MFVYFINKYYKRFISILNFEYRLQSIETFKYIIITYRYECNNENLKFKLYLNSYFQSQIS